VEHDGERVVPAASTIKIFIASAFWRSDLVTDGPENMTCARDLASGLAHVASEEPRIVDALASTRDSLLPYLVPDVPVAVKTGDLPGAYHEVAYIGTPPEGLAIAVCSSPPALPDAVARAAARLIIPSNR
jgi:beta-lactamase class A